MICGMLESVHGVHGISWSEGVMVGINDSWTVALPGWCDDAPGSVLIRHRILVADLVGMLVYVGMLSESADSWCRSVFGAQNGLVPVGDPERSGATVVGSWCNGACWRPGFAGNLRVGAVGASLVVIQRRCVCALLVGLVLLLVVLLLAVTSEWAVFVGVGCIRLSW